MSSIQAVDTAYAALVSQLGDGVTPAQCIVARLAAVKVVRIHKLERKMLAAGDDDPSSENRFLWREWQSGLHDDLVVLGLEHTSVGTIVDLAGDLETKQRKPS